MKLLSISKGSGEIARAHLTKPIMTIGRAPSCDVVLRAPGVAPVHFILEWAGSGKFDPRQTAWTITDVSKSADDGSGEGILLRDGVRGAVGSLAFRFIEDSLEVAPEIGGRILESLAKRDRTQGELLELVQIRDDSGAVEQVLHLRRAKVRRRIRPLPEVPEFRIEWHDKSEVIGVLKVISEEMPGAKVMVWGPESRDATSPVLGHRDLLKVQWHGRSFFLRLVPPVAVPKARRAPSDPLLTKVSVGMAALVLLAAFGLRSSGPPKEEPRKDPPRIARVEEIKHEEPKHEEVRPPAPETEKPPAAAGFETPVKKLHESAKASAPAVASRKTAKPRPGLNSPAPPTDINQVGILGALNRGGKQGPGVRADQVINNGIVTESVSGQNDGAPILVKNPPAGLLSNSKGGGSQQGGPGLTGASTTLAGAGKYDPSAVGPIAAKGGAAGYQLGAGGTGTGGQGQGLGDGIGTEGDGSSVEGGLSRDVVRKVIRSHASQIRTCYERGRLMRPGLQGRILYDWTISPGGEVTAAAILDSTVGLKALDLCVLEVIKGMVFPKAQNGGATRVKYPFVFQPLQ